MQGKVIACDTHTNQETGGIETVQSGFEERIEDHDDQPVQDTP
jgi:hypothetical protein